MKSLSPDISKNFVSLKCCLLNICFNLIRMRRVLLIGHILSIIAGSLIYIMFRTTSLRMFNWFDTLGLNHQILSLRNINIEVVEKLPSWFKYSLPDGLWVFSYVCLILLIWSESEVKKYLFWVLVIPSIAIISEFGQLANILPGTFDPVDIIFYLLGTFLPFTITNYSTIKI